VPRLPATTLSAALAVLLAAGGELEAKIKSEPPRVIAKRLLGGLDVTSGAVVVLRGGRRDFAAGFGNRAGRRASPRTPVPLGALAEPMLGAVLLASAGARVIDLDRPVTACGPTRGDQVQGRTKARPNARQLLAHSSGLIRRSGSTFLLFEPGSAWRPSADALDCLKRTIERSERDRFAAVAARRVLRPLGMRSTSLETADGQSSLDDLERLVRDQMRAPVAPVAPVDPFDPFGAWARADEELEWGAGWAVFEESGERLFARVASQGNLAMAVVGSPERGDAALVWVESPQGPAHAHSLVLRSIRALLDRPLAALDRTPLALAPAIAEPAAEPHHHHDQHQHPDPPAVDPPAMGAAAAPPIPPVRSRR
jgi:CubicO group peptidase (beta-lactamase class C family)